MATFILVHGAWHGAWCWECVIPLLQASNHQVFAPDLPGHGADKTPLMKITLKSYLECIQHLVESATEEVILVGHSMAGIIISQVAENKAEKIKKLIYIAAFLPQNGGSLFSLAQQQGPTPFSTLMRAEPHENAFYFPSEHVKAFAYHQCDEERVAQVKQRLCVEPLIPLATTVKLNEAFEQIPKLYIECEADQAVSLDLQRKMHQTTPCQVVSLPTDHSPFYSAPHALTDLLLAAAQ